MRRTAVLMIMALSLASGGMSLPRAQDDTRPAASNVPNSEYPRIHADLRVAFRVYAPDARKVQILPAPRVSNGLGDGPYDMIRDDKGFWAVTTPPAQPGLHNYFVVADGFAANDPGSEMFPGYGMICSAVEVPDKNGDFYEIKDVPHGEVRIRWYFSKVTGLWRRVLVYLPPDYERNAKERFPVLYLQHGSGEDERSWTAQGRANVILDNLIAEGKARPMIIVMDNGMVARRAGSPAPLERVAAILLQTQPSPPPAGANPAAKPPAAPRGNEAFEDVVIQDLVPMIDAAFRTIPDREHRAWAVAAALIGLVSVAPPRPIQAAAPTAMGVSIDGSRILAETSTLSTIFDRVVQVSLVRNSDKRELIRASAKEIQGVFLIYPGAEAVPFGNRETDKFTPFRINSRRAEFRIEGFDGDGILGISVDPATDDLVVELGLATSRPGVRSCRWLLAGIDPALDLVALGPRGEHPQDRRGPQVRLRLSRCDDEHS